MVISGLGSGVSWPLLSTWAASVVLLFVRCLLVSWIYSFLQHLEKHEANTLLFFLLSVDCSCWHLALSDYLQLLRSEKQPRGSRLTFTFPARLGSLCFSIASSCFASTWLSATRSSEIIWIFILPRLFLEDSLSRRASFFHPGSFPLLCRLPDFAFLTSFSLSDCFLRSGKERRQQNRNVSKQTWCRNIQNHREAFLSLLMSREDRKHHSHTGTGSYFLPSWIYYLSFTLQRMHLRATGG